MVISSKAVVRSKLRAFYSSSTLITILILVSLLNTVPVDSRSFEAPIVHHFFSIKDSRKINDVDKLFRQVYGSCLLERNEQLRKIAETVCLICHELYSNLRPNTRAECRANCFNNTKFQECLNFFETDTQQQQTTTAPTSL
ncbi:unnamed protein product [Enterobius vermicularis]|uniref:Uncharacterized protein n=1 Tax=Enterobius vermicularis TaxID=51028 RepID=A0A0N4VIT3_ENTVE|nr:unnamed protein product [Enterobius vermicularis]